MKKIAFIFPGQGAQYVGMGLDFFQNFSIAKRTFEEADDILSQNISKIIFEGPEDELTKTKNSQLALFITSIATLRVINEQFPNIAPSVCAGLSLGEYCALEASRRISFSDGLNLVKKRADFMNEACEKTKGTMAAILGISADIVESVMKEINPPHQVWAANYNCPGQIVISGTKEGVEVGIEELKKKGAKRAIHLPVHGAFHSGLMAYVQEKLKPEIDKVTFHKGSSDLVMNVIGDYVSSIEEVKRYLVEQITNSVRWEQGIRKMEEKGIELYLEIGSGETLKGMNRKIEVKAPTCSVKEVSDLNLLEELLK